MKFPEAKDVRIRRRCRLRRCAGPALLSALALSISPISTSALPEREVLIRFYNLAGGKHWTRADGWRDAAAAAAAAASEESATDDSPDRSPVCSWYGITCATASDPDVGRSVTEIDLSDNNLTGKVSKHLWTLPSLKRVNLRGNLLLDAGLEGYETLEPPHSPVEYLDIAENQIKSLGGVYGMRGTLEELRVSSNELESLPRGFFDLKKLKVLFLSSNENLRTKLPSDFGKLIHLRELFMSYCSFSGTIPSDLGLLTKMEYLEMDDNILTGALPPELNSMTNLKYLSLANSKGLEGVGSLTGTLPPYPDLVHLRELYVDGNDLSGPIPSDLLANSVETSKLMSLGLTHNRFSGTLPRTLYRFTHLQLLIEGNQIEEMPDDFCEMEKWMDGLVGQYGCDAIMCPIGYASPLGKEDGDGAECWECPNGKEGAPYMGATWCLGIDENNNIIPEEDTAGIKGEDVSEEKKGGIHGAAVFFICLAVLVVPISAFIIRKRLAYRRDQGIEKTDEVVNPTPFTVHAKDEGENLGVESHPDNVPGVHL